MSVITQGDTPLIAISLLKDEATFVIDNGADVKATLINKTTDVVAFGTPITLVNTTPGSDWPNSKVILPLTAIQTAGLSPGAYVIEVQITESGVITTWQIPSLVVRKQYI
jgi:hypothetical protein